MTLKRNMTYPTELFSDNAIICKDRSKDILQQLDYRERQDNINNIVLMPLTTVLFTYTWQAGIRRNFYSCNGHRSLIEWLSNAQQEVFSPSKNARLRKTTMEVELRENTN